MRHARLLYGTCREIREEYICGFRPLRSFRIPFAIFSSLQQFCAAVFPHGFEKEIGDKYLSLSATTRFASSWRLSLSATTRFASSDRLSLSATTRFASSDRFFCGTQTCCPAQDCLCGAAGLIFDVRHRSFREDIIGLDFPHIPNGLIRLRRRTRPVLSRSLFIVYPRSHWIVLAQTAHSDSRIATLSLRLSINSVFLRGIGGSILLQ